MEHSETIGQIAEALAKAQGCFKPVRKTITVDFPTARGSRVKYSYAPLSEIIEAVKKPLSDNGIAITQSAATSAIEHGCEVTIVTLLMHSSGEWLQSGLTLRDPSKDITTSPQTIGGLISYGRRYSLSAILGIAEDEGNDELIINESHANNASGNTITSNGTTIPPSFWVAVKNLGVSSKREDPNSIYRILGIQSLHDWMSKGHTLQEALKILQDKTKEKK
jgi:hypothetical protein